MDIPLVLSGTEFQKKVWAELRNIPYGATRSYKEQAESLGTPKAVRAVAKANGDNRLAILLPCHRVVGVHGELTGYGGGLWRKQFLLKHEADNLEGSVEAECHRDVLRVVSQQKIKEIWRTLR